MKRSLRFSLEFIMVLLFSLHTFTSGAQRGFKNTDIIDSLIRNIPSMMRSDGAKASLMISDLERLSKIENHRHGIINAALNKAWLSYRNDPVDEAIFKIDSALVNIKGINKDTTLAKFYILKGQCYVKKAAFDRAMENFNFALNIAEQRGDQDTKSSVLISIGWAYMENGKYNEAIKFFGETLKMNPSENYAHRAVLLCNIASCYNTTGNFKLAELYAERGIATARKRKSNTDLANGLNILARSYYQQGKIENAIAVLREASEARKKISDPAMLAADYLQLADLHIKNNQEELAIGFAKMALQIGLQHDNTLKLTEAYSTLSNAYESIGDYRNAFYYVNKLLAHKDSLDNDHYNNALAQMQVKYETEKKTAENLRLKQENLEARLTNVIQERWLIILAAGLILIVASALYMWNLMRGRYRTRLAVEQLKEQKARSVAVMEAEEKERRRIAADLHDGVGQTIAAASLYLNKVRKGQQTLDMVDSMILQAGKEVRDISHQVTPELLLHYGLVKAIEQAVERLNDSGNGINWSLFTHIESDLVDEMISLTLYRCFQELSTNIIKHSGASMVSVLLNLHHDEVQLMVEDDGTGFNPNKNGFGLGLRNMENRISLYEGELKVDSTPGNGTTTIIRIKKTGNNEKTGHISWKN